MDRLTDVVNKLAVPLGKFGMLPPIAAVQNGMIAAMPVIMVGAAFLIFFILGSPSVGEGGALLPFLEPYANAFVNMNSLTLGLMGLYCSLTIAQSYAEKLGVDVKSAGLPPAIFTVVEPVVFGLPLAFNPYLMIPFILSATVSMAVGYGLTMVGFFGRFFAALPWATPPFLLGPLGTGDIKTALLPVLAFVIGLVIYLPFWRVYEKKCLEEEAENEANAA